MQQTDVRHITIKQYQNIIVLFPPLRPSPLNHKIKNEANCKSD
jgi:hypothetical protein